MGEKGIAADALSTGTVSGVVGETTSIIERAGTGVTTSVTDAGADLVDTVRERAIEAAAEQVAAEGRERMRGPQGRDADTAGAADERPAAPDPE
jgi:hypothetical protein